MQKLKRIIGVALAGLLCSAAASTANPRGPSTGLNLPVGAKADSTAPAIVDEAGNGLFLIQTRDPWQSSHGDVLRDAGLQLISYVPEQSVLVYGNQSTVIAARATQFVATTAPLQTAQKRDPLLATIADNSRDIRVLYVQTDTIDARLRAAGATVLQQGKAQPDGLLGSARVEIARANIDAVAAIAEVVFIGVESPKRTDDEQASQIIGNNFVAPNVLQTGYTSFLNGPLGGLSGQGVTWAVVDSGADRAHPDIGPAWVGGLTVGCTQGNDGEGDDASDGGHGTHVTGALLGRALGDGAGPASEIDANGFRYGLGAAPGTGLFAVRAICTGNALTDPAITRAALLAGASGSNNSWNNSNNMPAVGYTISAREFDILVRDGDFTTPALREPFQAIFSAGNNGAAGLTGPHEAKNIISVANSGTPRDITTSNAELIAPTSSRGPAVDGRLMPTLTAPGSGISSARNALGGPCTDQPIAGTNSLYSLCSGTSMAAPRVSGAAALAVQWWRQRNSGTDPSPAMIKAMLINGARDVSGSVPGNLSLTDGSRPIPNPDEGWGIVDLRGTLSGSVQALYLEQGFVFRQNGEQYQFDVRATNPAQPLRVTLVWTDAPAAVNANPALVNDLDLQLVQGATTYRGNVFSAGASVAGGSADRLNNVENIYLASPGSGRYSLSVRAHAINADGLSGNGSPGAPAQDFVLVCRNCTVATLTQINASPTLVCAGQSTSTPLTLTTDAANTIPSVLSLDASAPSFISGAVFAPNPLVPVPGGGATMLQFAVDAAAPAGTVALPIRADALGTLSTLSAALTVFRDAPGTTSLSSPAAMATGMATNASFSWTTAGNSAGYRFELSRVNDFSAPWASANVSSTLYTPARALRANATYFWRVQPENPCANGSFVQGQFSTVGSDTIFTDGIGD